MDFTKLLTQLPFYANVGSVVGFLITVAAAIRQLRTRRRYLFLLRGPDLLANLEDHGSKLNRYDDLSEKERKTVLRECRSTLRNLSKHLDWSTWRTLVPLRWKLWWNWKNTTLEEADEIYARVQAAINEVNNLLLEKEAEQV